MKVRASRAMLHGPVFTLACALALSAGAIGCESEGLLSRVDLAGPSAAVTSLASLSMTPSKPTIPVGGTVQLKPTAYASGGVVVTTAVFTFSSVHPDIAQVDQNGLVTGVGPGGTTIRATTGGLTTASFVTVASSTTGGVAAVAVTPASSSAPVGSQMQLAATVQDSAGTVIPGAKVAWSSSAPATASVDSTGVVTALAAGSAAVTASSGGAQAQATVTVTTSSTAPATGSVVFKAGSPQQVMTGWEATAQAGQTSASFPLYSDQLYTMAADLGINRLRLEVKSGAENPAPAGGCVQYKVVNDDADPYHINPAGFHFEAIDSTVEQVVLPLRAKLAAQGKRLYLNLDYVAFNKSCGNVAAVHQDPQEYAEFAQAAFQHLQQRYGLVPDTWEMILEADNTTLFTGNGALVGQALVATASRLSAAGFHPAFIVPSTMQASNAPTYFDQLKTVPGASALVSEISYHRYGVSASSTDLANIATRAQSNGVHAAMLEKIGADYNMLIADLLQGRVSAWQQFTLCFPTTDNGGQYFTVNTSNPSSPVVVTGSRTRYFRQFFHYVTAGARRVDASTTQGGLTPVGFVNPDGKAVLVIRATAAASFSVQGLPAGTYGLRYTTAGATDAAAGADQAIVAGALVKGSIPAAGLITVFAR